MLTRRSIRFRLTIWYAAVLAAGLCLFGGLVWLGLRYKLLEDVDRDQRGYSDRFEKYFRAESHEVWGRHLRGELEEFSQALPPGQYIKLQGRDFSFEYPATGVPGGHRIVKRQFTADGQPFQLEVGAPINEVENTLHLLGALLLFLFPVVIAAASAGGAWLSARALRPVEEVTAAALTVSIENLGKRLPVPETDDELARLTHVLNTMLAKLESAVQTLSQFVADASHELRTPLAVIRATAEAALRRERPTQAYRAALEEVAGEAAQMTHLIEDLLTLARTGTASVEMPLSPLDLKDVLEQACAEMTSLAEARRVTIETRFESGPLTVSGNAAALHRLFLALLDNAIKYSHPGGSVIVTASSAGRTVSATVNDFGVGISDADLPHIFQRFYRADPAQSGAGHGLGLTLGQSIAKAHGTAIQVESQQGVGSSFSLTFPQRDANPQSRVTEARRGFVAPAN